MTTGTPFDAQAAARLLAAVWRGQAPIESARILPPTREAAFELQFATAELLGAVDGIGGWKVGAKGPDAMPNAAPLPRQGLLPDGALVPTGPGTQSTRMRGVELELAVRLGQDLPGRELPWTRQEIAQRIDAVFPALEVVETRLADWRTSDALAQLGDLQTHGALVLGAAGRVAPGSLDLRDLEACLTFDGQPVASTRGANPAGDLWRLLDWLAQHAQRMGRPLRAGQVITTGSCTGMLFAPEGCVVVGELSGLGRVSLRF